jgi:hypothetical protein
VEDFTPSGLPFVFAQRPDEGPVSQILLDAFFTNTVATGGYSYRRIDELGPRMRRFHPERDDKVVFIGVVQSELFRQGPRRADSPGRPAARDSQRGCRGWPAP